MWLFSATVSTVCSLGCFEIKCAKTSQHTDAFFNGGERVPNFKSLSDLFSRSIYFVSTGWFFDWFRPKSSKFQPVSKLRQPRGQLWNQFKWRHLMTKFWIHSQQIRNAHSKEIQNWFKEILQIWSWEMHLRWDLVVRQSRPCRHVSWFWFPPEEVGREGNVAMPHLHAIFK